MKKIIVVSVFLLMSAFLYAQVPQAINFQAIARDGSGNPMVNTSIQIRLSVIDSAQSGTIVYQELRALQTNVYGSFSFQIGVNANFTTIGTLQGVDWTTGNKHLKIDYDPTNTFNFSLTLGVIKFVTVPYAFTAQNVIYIDATGAQNGDVLVYNAATGKFEPGTVSAGSVDWTNVQNKPAFAPVSTSGSYTDLSNKPTTDGSETIVTAGTNVTITGAGTIASPYVINATTSGVSLLPPTVTTQAASNVQIISATLNGIVNANGLSTTVVFEWGLTTAYGNTATATPNPVTGTSNISVSADLTGLQGNTTYHYRIKATNAVNITYSSDMSVTTIMLIPTVITGNFSDVRGNSAKADGSVTYDGGSPILAQGLCWSTSINPTIANSFNTSFTGVMSGLLPNTLYYVRAYATNLAGTGYGNQISFSSGYLIGSTFGGGLVFYNDGAEHGFVSAPSDQSTAAIWGCWDTMINVTPTALGTGAHNTNCIVIGCPTPGIAAKICYDLVLNTYSDWFLPSRDELNLMYLNLKNQGLGGFSNDYYWASSEYAGYEFWFACNQYFGNGAQDSGNKGDVNSVRAIRAF